MHIVAFDCCFSSSFYLLPLILGIEDGQTITISPTSYFPCYISPRQKKSSNLFVKLRSDLRIHPAGTNIIFCLWISSDPFLGDKYFGPDDGGGET
jgi:hypothetical protein